MKLDQPPNVMNLFVFWDHFIKHIMAYMTPNQTVKIFTKILWQGYILIFQAPAKLLNNQGANFESNIIRELCRLTGIQKVRTSPYHAQTNGQVEWANQTLMHMIGKLSKDWKVDWPKYLPELVHAYNSMRSAITGYSPHYLMFVHWLLLPINLYFFTIRDTKHQFVAHYIAKQCEWLGKSVKRLKCSPHQRQRDRSSTMIGKLTSFHWNQVIWYWLKLTPTGRGGNWKISGRRNHMKWSAKLWKASLPTSWRTSRQDAHGSSNEIDVFCTTLTEGTYLYGCGG